jgi:hypothetical protein
MAPDKIDPTVITPGVGELAPLVGSGGIGGIGVKGLAIEGTGVKGEAAGDKGTGVKGEAPGVRGTGVKGEAPGDKGIGVKGEAGAIGVWGYSTIGTGVYGETRAPADVGAAVSGVTGRKAVTELKGLRRRLGKPQSPGSNKGITDRVFSARALPPVTSRVMCESRIIFGSTETSR